MPGWHIYYHQMVVCYVRSVLLVLRSISTVLASSSNGHVLQVYFGTPFTIILAQSGCRLFCHVSKFVFAKLDEAAAFFCVAALHADGYQWPVMLIPINVCATFIALHARITEPAHIVVGVVLRFGLTLFTRVG